MPEPQYSVTWLIFAFLKHVPFTRWGFSLLKRLPRPGWSGQNHEKHVVSRLLRSAVLSVSGPTESRVARKTYCVLLQSICIILCLDSIHAPEIGSASIRFGSAFYLSPLITPFPRIFFGVSMTFLVRTDGHMDVQTLLHNQPFGQ